VSQRIFKEDNSSTKRYSKNNADIFLRGPVQGAATPLVAHAYADVTIRMSHVMVNGTPLDVGPNCRIATPITLKLFGSTGSAVPYLVDRGGRLEGKVDIPPFVGCGVGDNLDALFTAAVSGKGNFIRIIQAEVCDPAVQTDPAARLRTPCPPGAHYGYNITPGGPWVANSSNFSFADGGAQFSCQSSSMNGVLGSGVGIREVGLGRITGFSAANCSAALGDGTPVFSTFTVTPTPQSLPWTMVADYFDNTNGASVVHGHLVGESLDISAPATATDPACNFTMSAPSDTLANSASQFPFVYDNNTHVFTFGDAGAFNPATLNVSNTQGCSLNGNPLVSDGDPVNPVLGDYAFTPPQNIVRRP
jgi:hypothetical protein